MNGNYFVIAITGTAGTLVTTIAAAIAALGVGGVVLTAILNYLAAKRKNYAIRRDLRDALTSLQLPITAAAARGMADPDKWEPLIVQIEKRMEPIDTLVALNDRQSRSIRDVIRESRVVQMQIRAWSAEAVRRFETEPAPVRTAATDLAEAINGEQYDPRIAEFRTAVKRSSIPLDTVLRRARAAFRDTTVYLNVDTRKQNPRTRSFLTRVRDFLQ